MIDERVNSIVEELKTHDQKYANIPKEPLNKKTLLWEIVNIIIIALSVSSICIVTFLQDKYSDDIIIASFVVYLCTLPVWIIKSIVSLMTFKKEKSWMNKSNKINTIAITIFMHSIIIYMVMAYVGWDLAAQIIIITLMCGSLLITLPFFIYCTFKHSKVFAEGFADGFNNR